VQFEQKRDATIEATGFPEGCLFLLSKNEWKPENDYLNQNCPLPHFQRSQFHITIGFPTRLDRYSVNLEHITNYLQNSQQVAQMG
jgi:hypothetical protein